MFVAPIKASHPSDVKVSVNLPGSKSLALRYLAIAALATGESSLGLISESEDRDDMLNGLKKLNINFEVIDDQIKVNGCKGKLPPGDVQVDLKLSGVTARFLAAFALLRDGSKTTITGHESLSLRPLGGVVDVLKQFGCQVNRDYLPIEIYSPRDRGLVASVEVAGNVSSQFLSSILVIAPCLSTGLEIKVPTNLVSQPYVRMTLKSQELFGARITEIEHNRFKVEATGYQSTKINAEPDASAASYFAALAALHGFTVAFKGIYPDSLQGDVAFFTLLQSLGAVVTSDANGFTVTGRELTAVKDPIDLSYMPDVAPTLCAIAPFIPGGLHLIGLETLRVKECNRIEALNNELTKIGIKSEIIGLGELKVDEVNYSNLTGLVEVDTYDDHRMAMSLAVLATKLPLGLKVKNPNCVAKTFPKFWNELSKFYSN